MKDLIWIREGYFAHRGLHTNDIPENSMKAFEHAVKNGYDIELDIRITKDHKIIAIHDSNLERLTGCNIIVEDCDYETISTCKLYHSNEVIPLFEDVLKKIPVTTKLLIELKSSSSNKALVNSFLTLMSQFKHQYAIQSFDPRIIHQFKKKAPLVIRGQISKIYKGFAGFVLSNLLLNFWTKPDFITYKLNDLPRKRLDTLHKKGVMVISYTAHSESELSFVKSHYDNAVFEGFMPKKN